MFFKFKLHFFLSTTLSISTILSMQSSFVSYAAKAMKDTKTTADKQQTTVLTLVASFANLNLEDGDFSPFPLEIVRNIIHLVQCDYPWDEMIQFIKMRRVCKRWLSILSNMDAIAKHLKIPPLHFAAMKNDAGEIMRLKLTNICSLLEPDHRGFRAAHYALATKAHHAIKLLKIGSALDTLRQDSKKLEPFVVDNDPISLTILNADYDKQCTIEELIEFVKNGNSIELADALSKMKNPEIIVNLLLDIPKEFTANAKPFMRLLRFALTSRLEYAFFEAICNSRNLPPHFFQLLKGCNANLNVCDEFGRTALTRTCIYSDLLPTLIELLKCENIDVNLPSKDEAMLTPIHVAAHCNNIQAAQTLLELKDDQGKCRVNVDAKNSYGCTPLYITAEKAEKDDSYNLFELLVQHGADVNLQDDKNGFAPIHLAAQNGCVKILEALTNNPTCNIELLNAIGDTPLVVAAMSDQNVCVESLLQKRAHPLCIDTYGNTLLHNTAREGSIKSMRKLLPYLQKEINTPNNNGFAPLHTALIAGKVECAQLLLNAGAIVGIKTRNGDTPLHYAASNNNVQGIELLFSSGACIDAKNNSEYIFNNMHLGGYRPLHYAARRGHLPAVQKLVELGANTRANTTLNKTALDLAFDFEHQEVGKYLAEQMSPDTPNAWAHYQHIRNW